MRVRVETRGGSAAEIGAATRGSGDAQGGGCLQSHANARAVIPMLTVSSRAERGIGPPVATASMFVYILASKTRRLYVGITSHLVRRMWQHKTGVVAGFTRRYGIDRLVYYEVIREPETAIRREKQMKKLCSGKEACSHRLDEPELGRPGRTLVSKRWASRSLATLGMTRGEGSG